MSIEHPLERKKNIRKEILGDFKHKSDFLDPKNMDDAIQKNIEYKEEQIEGTVSSAKKVRLAEELSDYKQEVKDAEDNYQNQPEILEKKRKHKYQENRAQAMKEFEERIDEAREAGGFAEAEQLISEYNDIFLNENSQKIVKKVLPEISAEKIGELSEHERKDYIYTKVIEKATENGTMDVPPSYEQTQRYIDISNSLADLSNNELENKKLRFDHLEKIKRYIQNLSPEVHREINVFVQSILEENGITPDLPEYENYYANFIENIFSKEIINNKIEEELEELFIKESTRLNRSLSAQEKHDISQNLLKSKIKSVEENIFTELKDNGRWYGKRAFNWAKNTVKSIFKWSGLGLLGGVGTFLWGTTKGIWDITTKYIFKEGIDAFKNPFKGFKI